MFANTTASGAQEELLHRIANGDREALGIFYDQVAALLFSVAARILGDSLEAEEVIQDVFVQIWQKSATFDPALGKALPWALGITRNRAVDRIRGRQRHARLLAEFQALPNPATEIQTAQDLPTDERKLIVQALASLPADQKESIELAFFAGLTHVEISERLEEPVGTIKARIRRGMLKLRESLGKDL
jgi:RNA polymerase sigma-70 factor (ECF subfamily)